jgi:hypothetical protein
MNFFLILISKNTKTIKPAAFTPNFQNKRAYDNDPNKPPHNQNSQISTHEQSFHPDSCKINIILIYQCFFQRFPTKGRSVLLQRMRANSRDKNDPKETSTTKNDMTNIDHKKPVHSFQRYHTTTALAMNFSYINFQNHKNHQTCSIFTSNFQNKRAYDNDPNKPPHNQNTGKATQSKQSFHPDSCK